MPKSHLKYSEYTRLSHACVNLSWTSLNKTREEYHQKVEANKSLLAEVITRLIKNKKILHQAEERTKKKILYLASKLRDSSAEVNATAEDFNYPAANALVGFSLTI
jgi:anaerobic ribonucleoside-triphosphate reductase